MTLEPLTTSPFTEAIPQAVDTDEYRSRMVARALYDVRHASKIRRAASARILGDWAQSWKVPLPQAVMPLLYALSNDPDEHVREECAWALWKLNDRRAHAGLLHALEHDAHVVVRDRAARALGLMGVVVARPILRGWLAIGRNTPERLRAAAVAALGLIGDQEDLPMLMTATHDAAAPVRAEALRALGAMRAMHAHEKKDPILKILCRFTRRRYEPQPHVRKAAIAALRLRPDAKALAAVCAAMQCDADAGVRVAAVRSLPCWEDPKVEDALIIALQDAAWSTRKAAAIALCDLLRLRGYVDAAQVHQTLRMLLRTLPATGRERTAVVDVLGRLSAESVESSI